MSIARQIRHVDMPMPASIIQAEILWLLLGSSVAWVETPMAMLWSSTHSRLRLEYLELRFLHALLPPSILGHFAGRYEARPPGARTNSAQQCPEQEPKKGKLRFHHCPVISCAGPSSGQCHLKGGASAAFACYLLHALPVFVAPFKPYKEFNHMLRQEQGDTRIINPHTMSKEALATGA